MSQSVSQAAGRAATAPHFKLFFTRWRRRRRLGHLGGGGGIPEEQDQFRAGLAFPGDPG